MPRKHGYAPVGKRSVGKHNGHARGRLNVVGALLASCLLTVSRFSGSYISTRGTCCERRRKDWIQALERKHPTRPMIPGKPEAREFEYERHGTQTLIASFQLATGQVVCLSIGQSRTEDDLVAHIQSTLETDLEGEWVFICDQLNTHQSEGLVRAIAKHCGITDELGKTGQLGILYNMASRAAFLPAQNHRVRLVYTPKNCSWLNQIEIWFGILTRRLLKRGSFTSTEELKRRMLSFIEYFNQTLAKPFRWTYIGKPLRVLIIQFIYDERY